MLSVIINSFSHKNLESIIFNLKKNECIKQIIFIGPRINNRSSNNGGIEIIYIQSYKKPTVCINIALKKVNQELSEVQKRLEAAEKALDKALEGYNESLNNLAAIQENIINEQITLGATKNQISKVKDELFETQKNLNSAKGELQNKAVDMYINGVMSPTTALFIELKELSNFLVALGYASTVVDSAYEIVEQLNALEKLASNQTEFLTQREDERIDIVANLQNEEERKNGYIFNLGHGISQYTPPENVSILVDTIRDY